MHTSVNVPDNKSLRLYYFHAFRQGPSGGSDCWCIPILCSFVLLHSIFQGTPASEGLLLLTSCTGYFTEFNLSQLPHAMSVASNSGHALHWASLSHILCSSTLPRTHYFQGFHSSHTPWRIYVQLQVHFRDHTLFWSTHKKQVTKVTVSGQIHRPVLCCWYQQVWRDAHRWMWHKYCMHRRCSVHQNWNREVEDGFQQNLLPKQTRINWRLRKLPACI